MNVVFDNFTGECFICNKQRKFKDLDVRTINLDEFSVFNMIYCNDSMTCVANARIMAATEVNEKLFNGELV